MNVKPLHGLVAATFTPFLADGSLNLDLIERQAASLVKNGVAGAFICGTTGESMSLTTEERMQIAERWAQIAPLELRIIVHVGHNSLGDCQALARHAQKIGAAAIGQLAPSFFKPASVEPLVSFCAEVAAAAPDLPYYYYHIPAFTGVTIPCSEFLTMAGDKIPNLAGAKFTHEQLADYLACQEIEAGRYDLLFGRDEMLVAAMAMGAKGAIGSTYNYGAPIFREVMAAFDQSGLPAARAAQSRANGMINAMVRHGGLVAAKTIMRLIGLDCGPVRLPLRGLSAEKVESLKRELESCGYFDFCSKV